MKPSSFDPRAIFDAVITAWSSVARAKGLALAPLVYGNVPAKVRGDGASLLQALGCLLENAIAATPSGEITLSLTGQLMPAQSAPGAQIKLRCAVSDRGTGLDTAAREQILGGFKDPSSASELGLAARLVSQMGGEIGLESAPGEGSTFWFTACFQAEKSRKMARVPRPAPWMERSERLRFLIAEDDPINQRIALHQLSQLGYEADVVGNGAEALEWLARTRYDLIFLDCQMPELDGWATARAIKGQKWEQNGPRRPFLVALTSLDSPANRRKCREAGMDDFLAKPLERGALRKCLGRWLGDEFEAQGTETETLETDFLVQLIPLFLEDAPARLHSMRRALETENPRALEQAAHTLKGSSALLGATPMSVWCEKLETLGQSGSLEGAPDALDELEREFAGVRRDLQEQLDSNH